MPDQGVGRDWAEPDALADQRRFPSPAKGIVIGLIIGLAAWIGIGAAIFAWWF